MGKNIKLPKGIKAMSLVDLSNLNLSDAAISRVSAKVSEAVLSEYASTKKAKVSGIIGDLRGIGLPGWAGYIDTDYLLSVKRFEKIGELVKNHIISQG